MKKFRNFSNDTLILQNTLHMHVFFFYIFERIFIIAFVYLLPQLNLIHNQVFLTLYVIRELWLIFIN